MPRRPAGSLAGGQGVRSDPASEGFEEKYRAVIEWESYRGRCADAGRRANTHRSLSHHDPKKDRGRSFPLDCRRKRKPARLLRLGVTKDVAAVHAALVQPWSNGQTEGQITKLKLVKRQMYGRAKIDLLQARLIGAT
jgi:transposase